MFAVCALSAAISAISIQTNISHLLEPSFSNALPKPKPQFGDSGIMFEPMPYVPRLPLEKTGDVSRIDVEPQPFVPLEIHDSYPRG